jgi:hypothetical protein
MNEGEGTMKMFIRNRKLITIIVVALFITILVVFQVDANKQVIGNFIPTNNRITFPPPPTKVPEDYTPQPFVRDNSGKVQIDRYFDLSGNIPDIDKIVYIIRRANGICEQYIIPSRNLIEDYELMKISSGDKVLYLGAYIPLPLSADDYFFIKTPISTPQIGISTMYPIINPNKDISSQATSYPIK